MGSAAGEGLETLLDEQVRYYRAVAAEYEHALPLPGGAELAEALSAFRPTGSVLELACGPGTWTGHLRHHAADVTAAELIEDERSSTIQRRLTDGTAYRIVKVPHQPADLERQLGRIGWRVQVHATSGPFFWGTGGRSAPVAAIDAAGSDSAR